METRIAEHSNGLQAELEIVRRRLQEAEATLEAIRMGNVDALVVSGAEGEVEIRTILNMSTLATTIFNQVAQPTFILDGRHQIRRLNQAALELLGFDPGTRPFLEVLPLRTEMRDGHSSDPLDGWIEKGEHIEALDVNYEHPRLGTRFYLLDANPQEMGWDGMPGGIITLMDITARKIAEIQLAVRGGQLRAQLALLQSITDNIPEGLLLLDEDRRVIFHNPALLAILDLPKSDLAGLDVADIFKPEPEAVPGAGGRPGTGLNRAFDPHAGKFRASLRRRDGTSLPVEYQVYPVKDESMEGALLVISDISMRVASEKALMQSLEKQQQSQKMEAVGRLAGGIAHDFNNLLLAILGFTDLSLFQVEEGSGVHGNLVEVKKAGERAAALTGQLLAYSRKQMLAPKVRNLNETVRDLQKMLERMIGETIQLDFRLFSEALWADIDQAKLQQVLVNMTLNARDAMPQGGTLTVATGGLTSESGDRSGMVKETLRESSEGLPPGRYVWIELADSGHGMDKSVLDHLFEPFFTTKEFGKGSGLGLSTAYGIIKQMGGHVQVFSATGKGSLFRILLPMSAQPGTSGPEVPAESLPIESGSGETILLVEDETVVRKLLAKILVDQGYRVIQAGNGEEALRNLPGPETPVSLVITDLIMDKMGGTELAERLDVIRPGLDILFISGYSEDRYNLSSRRGEAPFFAAKPFRAADFLKLVRSILKRKTGAT